METTSAKKGDYVFSTNLDPSTDWIVHLVTSMKIVVKDKCNPSDKQSLKHGDYMILDDDINAH